jgi:hypothetical protein
MQFFADSDFDPIAFADALANQRAGSIAENVERWRAWMATELPELLALPHDALASRPGLWAWLFPTGSASRADPTAPRIGRRELAAAVEGDPVLRDALVAAFSRVLVPLDLVEVDGALTWREAPAAWALSTRCDRRVYRMLRCLHVAGLGREATMVMAFLGAELGGDPRRAEALSWYRHQVAC